MGQTIEISTLEPKRGFEVVGIARYGDVKSLGTATFAIFDVATAQEFFDREGSSTRSPWPATRDPRRRGWSPTSSRSSPPMHRCARAPRRPRRRRTRSAVHDVHPLLLLAFAGIALFVGSFVIFNTLSITVAQRTREFATLRTLGASRRQVLRSVLLEAIRIGFLASVVGLFLAPGSRRVSRRSSAPSASTCRSRTRSSRPARSSSRSSSWTSSPSWPGCSRRFARRACRRSRPCGRGGSLPKGGGTASPRTSRLLIALALGLLGYSMFADDVDTAQRLSIAGGVLLLFVGVAMISSKLVRLLAAVGHARTLAGRSPRSRGGNAVRNLSRTARRPRR